MKRDILFSLPLSSVKDFAFDENTAAVFDDMIERSVPLYQDIQHATARLCRCLAQDQSRVYDLGCASGTTLVLLAEHLAERPIEIIGIDNSGPMLEECEKKIAASGWNERILVEQADIRTYQPEHASVIILNYTLQFLPVKERAAVLKRLASGLLPGGALLLSEKVTHRSETLNRVLYDMHHQFKRSRGYSDLEIAQKRDSIENVLVPLSTEENCALLRDAGFREVEVYAKWYNFASFIAFRG
jgi:tRNA (cmo5U34)-methyltransferase